jgi:D-threo-aldose 1-dehydrogenase
MTGTIPQRRVGTTGLALSELGLGTAPLGNLYEPMSDTTARAILDAAVYAGICYVDTAPFYGFGLSERRVGDGLRCQRSCVISTKVGRLLEPDACVIDDSIRFGFRSSLPFKPVFDYSHDAILRSWEASLQRLGRARIDLLYVHDVGAATHGAAHPAMWHQLTAGGGFRALERLRDEGSIGGFGLGVNEIAVCLEAMNYARLDALLLAGRYTLLEQGALDELFPQAKAGGTAVIVGGPYNSGILAVGTRAAGTRSSAPPQYNYAPAPADVIARVARIEAVCERHAVSLAAAALQFPLAHPQVASVIPGIASVAQLWDTLRFYRMPIAPRFWEDLKSQGLLRDDAPVPDLRSSPQPRESGR